MKTLPELYPEATPIIPSKNHKNIPNFKPGQPAQKVDSALKSARKIPAAVVPVRVNLEMSPSQFARYEKLWEKVCKQRNIAPEKVEALLEIKELFLVGDCQNGSPRVDNSSAGKLATQIHIHHCPECEASTVQTSKGELEIGKREYERYQCDCQTSSPNSRNVASIARRCGEK